MNLSQPKPSISQPSPKSRTWPWNKSKQASNLSTISADFGLETRPNKLRLSQLSFAISLRCNCVRGVRQTSENRSHSSKFEPQCFFAEYITRPIYFSITHRSIPPHQIYHSLLSHHSSFSSPFHLPPQFFAFVRSRNHTNQQTNKSTQKINQQTMLRANRNRTSNPVSSAASSSTAPSSVQLQQQQRVEERNVDRRLTPAESSLSNKLFAEIQKHPALRDHCAETMRRMRSSQSREDKRQYAAQFIRYLLQYDDVKTQLYRHIDADNAAEQLLLLANP